MSTCTFCDDVEPKFKELDTNNVFCNDVCQQIHYLIIGDNTSVIPSGPLAKIMYSLNPTELRKMCMTNTRINSICKQDWFRKNYIATNGVYEMLESMHAAIKYRYSPELDDELSKWFIVMKPYFVVSDEKADAFYEDATKYGFYQIVFLDYTTPRDPRTVWVKNIQLNKITSYGHLNIIKLMKQVISISTYDSHEYFASTLQEAIIHNHIDVLEWALAEIDDDGNNRYIQDILRTSIKAKNPIAFEILLKDGRFDPSRTDIGVAVLQSKSVPITRLYLDDKRVVNIIPLHNFIEFSSKGIIQMVLDSGKLDLTDVRPLRSLIYTLLKRYDNNPKLHDTILWLLVMNDSFDAD